jgi:hypothetical protein
MPRASASWLPGTIVDLAVGLTGLCVPIGLTIAVLKYRLFDIDVVINRAIVYGGLTVAVIGLYVLVVGYLGALFRTGGNLPISLIATAIVAILFQPLRGWLQRGANRLLYGERDEPYAVISRLGRRLEGHWPRMLSCRRSSRRSRARCGCPTRRSRSGTARIAPSPPRPARRRPIHFTCR